MEKNKLLLICILGSILALIIVHFLYSIPAPFDFLESKWDAGDLITYLGTVFLGIVAIVQTDKSFKLSQKLAENEPFFIVTNYSAYKVEDIINYFIKDDDKMYIYVDNDDINDIKERSIILVEIVNTSSSIETISFKSANSKKIEWSNTIIENNIKILSIRPGEKKKIGFIASDEYFSKCVKEKLNFEFKLRNNLGKCYKETFQLIIDSYVKGDSIRADGHYIDCSVSNYDVLVIEEKNN